MNESNALHNLIQGLLQFALYKKKFFLLPNHIVNGSIFLVAGFIIVTFLLNLLLLFLDPHLDDGLANHGDNKVQNNKGSNNGERIEA